jgi:CPA1 family monovalent cation:H+ antiporter
VDAGERIMELDRQRIDGHSSSGEKGALTRKTGKIERKLRLAGLRAERGEIYRIARSRKLTHEMARKIGEGDRSFGNAIRCIVARDCAVQLVLRH